jgi:DNA mismatch repair protein MutS
MSEINSSEKFPSTEERKKYTPVLRQYLDERAKVGDDAILLFRLGDFYESFFYDAEVLAKELEIVLTARSDSAHPNGKVPMAGIPFRTADGYIAKLLKAGIKVAICEQVGEVTGKGPMQRALTRILTPGTLTESEYLSGEKANYLAAIFPDSDDCWGLAFIDISTAQIRIAELSEKQLRIELNRIAASEILVSSTRVRDQAGIYIEQLLLPKEVNKSDYSITGRAHNSFDLEVAKSKIKKQFGEHSLSGFGIVNFKPGLRALGAILEYLEFTYPESIKSLRQIQIYETGKYLKLDEQTIKNLEIFETLKNRTKKGSLFGLLESEITTKMGARLLREWLSLPLLRVNEIKQRQLAIKQLLSSNQLRSKIKEALNGVSDLERLAVKLDSGKLNPRELGWVKNSLLKLPFIGSLSAELVSPPSPLLMGSIKTNTIDELPDEAAKLFAINLNPDLIRKAEELNKALLDELPVISSEGGIIQSGYSFKMDEIKALVEHNEAWLQKYENTEREKTGIRALKVAFNKAAGFYIEISKANKDLVPADYKIKQNLTNIDRYLTPELKEYEAKFLAAESQLQGIEYEIFCFLRDTLAAHAEEIREISKSIASIDCLIALAEIAQANKYICPEINDSNELRIENGRHPVIEQAMPNGRFVGNDLELISVNPNEEVSETPQVMILTGPNMSGKSTFMKQNALLVLLAQIGSYIPANSATIGIVDRIFTRISSSDDLSQGQSTFMVEMTETAYLLNNMTDRSLILLDEIGRGTSTYDGVAIAWAVVEYLAKKGPRTIFATHYHELNGLTDLFKQIVNYQVSVYESDEELTFLYKVIPGGADRSYGIQVAKMAGLPTTVLNRAQGIMAQINAREIPAKRRSLINESIEQTRLNLT